MLVVVLVACRTQIASIQAAEVGTVATDYLHLLML